MSRGETIVRWMRERYGARFVALAAVVGCVDAVSADRWDASSLTRSVAVAWLVILALRVWDDLADRDVDAQRHPERVSVIGDRVALEGLAVFAALAASGLLAIGPQPLMRFLIGAALATALLFWYALRPPRRLLVADALVLMAKYPVIALISASSLQTMQSLVRELPLLVGLYLLLLLYEVVGSVEADPSLRSG